VNPTVKVTEKGGDAARRFQASLSALTRKKVYVGVPATTATERMAEVLKMSGKATGKRRRRYMALVAKNLVNNAQLVYIHSNGSPLRHIPARPIIEPALKDAENMALYMPELEAAAKAALGGNVDQVAQHLQRAGLIAQNVVRQWFVNPKNAWAPNAPSTIKAKDSSRPLIDTSSMRKSITFVVSDDAL
jgi:hypothetical protein